MKRGIRIVLLACWLAAGNLFGAAETKVHLFLSAESAKPGETIWAAVQMQMPIGWHTYWKNPGDSGSATEIQWTLPEGISVGEIRWPVPEKNILLAGNLTLITYVFEDEAVLLVPLKILTNISFGEKTISAKVDWQECETLCVLGKKTVTASLVVGSDSKPSSNVALFESSQKKLPQQKTEFSVSSFLENASDSTGTLRIDVADGGEWDFFPYTNSAAKISGETKAVTSAGFVRLQKEITRKGATWPKEISGVLVRLENGKPTVGYEVSLTPTKSESASSGGTAIGNQATSKKSLWKNLIFAFLGGLILNFMPCVLPVISLKVLSFVNQSKESSGRRKALGLFYGVGVLASFLVFAVLAIGVQKAGGVPSWNMVLQNQTFRLVLTVLMTLVALNLFGLFEITLSGKVMGAAGNLSAKEGLSGAFFNGVLATILATSCTAPILATAVGFAFTRPPPIVILMFLMVGVGLAAPFVILCWKPNLLKILPRPGAWMEKFKIAMGFPMLATAVWLFWFTAPGLGDSGELQLGLFLVIVSAAAWIWGEFVQRGRTKKLLAIIISLLLVASGSLLLRPTFDKIDWQTWSPEAVSKARKEGHPVLVDFTAKNCINCKVNKSTSIEIPATRNKLKEIGAVAFLGDFTNEDPRIADELRRYERAGVPLVLVYPKNPNEPAIVLPPLLTPSIVAEALEKAAK